jgi:hypothetical protein
LGKKERNLYIGHYSTEGAILKDVPKNLKDKKQILPLQFFNLLEVYGELVHK